MATRVTVLISAYNEEPFLAAAIDSVLAQTFPDFDLLVVDDASTDRSRALVESYGDPRVRLLVNPTNLGGGASRNRGLATIASEYIAMLDGNDLCFPQRLARQVRYLDEHPESVVVGAEAILIDVAGRRIGEFRRPSSELGIRWCRMFQSPVIHSSATFRRAVVWNELGGYEERYRYGEDFDLWHRLAKKHAIHNLPEPLVAYRADPMSITSTARHPARDGYPERKAPMILENLRDTLQGIEIPPRWVECWLALGDVTSTPSEADVRDAIEMIEVCAAHFAAIHGENEEVVAHQAEMLVRALGKATAASRFLSLRTWLKTWRHHRKTALRALPRFVGTFVLGELPLRVYRELSRRRARRWRIHASQ